MNSGSAEQCNNVSWISLCLFIDAVIVLLYFELEFFMWCDVRHFFLHSHLASSPKNSSASELILQFLFPSHIWQLSTFFSEIMLISLHFRFLQWKIKWGSETWNHCKKSRNLSFIQKTLIPFSVQGSFGFSFHSFSLSHLS